MPSRGKIADLTSLPSQSLRTLEGTSRHGLSSPSPTDLHITSRIGPHLIVLRRVGDHIPEESFLFHVNQLATEAMMSWPGWSGIVPLEASSRT